MSHRNIVRAWKDEEYRMSLSEAERSRLPENPVGAVELTDADLAGAAGGIYRPSLACPSVGLYRCTSSSLTPCCY
ncbi:MAG: mersacidin/lichenicidin family type 2 lantibiotic [Terriglobia bacterium]